MFDDILSALDSYLRPGTRNGRLGLLAIGFYLLLSAGSIAFGLSGDVGNKIENALGAQVAWDAGSGQRTLMLTNQSNEDWTHVSLILDERYYHNEEVVSDGHSVAIRTQDLSDGYLLPRPHALYAYEQIFPAPVNEHHVPLGYTPNRIRLSTEQGDVVITESSP
jgi:hypothetical protein